MKRVVILAGLLAALALAVSAAPASAGPYPSRERAEQVVYAHTDWLCGHGGRWRCMGADTHVSCYFLLGYSSRRCSGIYREREVPDFWNTRTCWIDDWRTYVQKVGEGDVRLRVYIDSCRGRTV